MARLSPFRFRKFVDLVVLNGFAPLQRFGGLSQGPGKRIEELVIKWILGSFSTRRSRTRTA
jgi:hypothetical protein